MQNNEKCELCNSKDLLEFFELSCCQKKYCKLCMIHLKADKSSNCQNCKQKLSFSKVFSNKTNLKKHYSEPLKIYNEKKLILE